MARCARFGVVTCSALLALLCLGGVAFADDDHGGRGRERDRDDEHERGGGVTTTLVQPYQPSRAAVSGPVCARLDPSVATVQSVLDQMNAQGGLSLNQAALIGNALYLSAGEVQAMPFEQVISVSMCAGVALDTLAGILSGA
jgi:hypothetical protein